MKKISFCFECPQTNPTPTQRVFWANGHAFCRTNCRKYIDAVKAARERHTKQLIGSYAQVNEQLHLPFIKEEYTVKER